MNYDRLVSRLRYKILSGYYDDLSNYETAQEKKAVRILKAAKELKIKESEKNRDITPPFYLG